MRATSHAGYDYASADALYQIARAELAAVGLAPWQDELEIELIPPEGSQKKGWIRARYAMALTPDGRKPGAGEVEHITVMSQATGAQAFAAIRTFALKYWLRGKLLLATGEQLDDVDAMPKEPPPMKSKSKSKSAPQQAPAADDAAGRWVLELATGEYRKVGLFESDVAAQRLFLSQIARDMKTHGLPTSSTRTASWWPSCPTPAASGSTSRSSGCRSGPKARSEPVVLPAPSGLEGVATSSGLGGGGVHPVQRRPKHPLRAKGPGDDRERYLPPGAG